MKCFCLLFSRMECSGKKWVVGCSSTKC
jgi:hypothetical protein